MAKKFNWSVTLRPNAFTPDNDRDQLADVVPAGTKKDEDIADEIVAEGSEIKKETILNILSLRNKKVMAYALAGYNYSNEVEQMTPRVNSVFEDINHADRSGQNDPPPCRARRGAGDCGQGVLQLQIAQIGNAARKP